MSSDGESSREDSTPLDPGLQADGRAEPTRERGESESPRPEKPGILSDPRNSDSHMMDSVRESFGDPGASDGSAKEGAVPQEQRPEVSVPVTDEPDAYPLAEVVQVGDHASHQESESPPSLQFLHWSSPVFDIIAHFRQYLVPLALAFLSATGQNWYWGMLALIALTGSLVQTIFRYFTLRYGIFRGELVVNQGLFFRSIRTVPVRRIQNIDVRQNILHRLLGVCEVHVETAGGTESEAALRVLKKSDVERLRMQVYHHQRLAGAATTAGTVGEELPELASDSQPIQNSTALEESNREPVVTLLEIPWPWLARVGLASNRGWLVVGVALGMFYQFSPWEDMSRDEIRDLMRNWMPNVDFDLQHAGFWLALGILGLVLLKAFGVVWYIGRFYGYVLTRDKDDLRVTCGLFTSYSATIPRGRIQFISIQSSWMMRWLGVARICVETAGGAGSGEDSGHAQIMRSSFVPAIPVERVNELLNELRPGLGWNESTTEWRGPAPRAAVRLARVHVLLSVLLTIAGGIWWWPWGLLLLPLSLPICLWYARRLSRSLRYARTSFGVAYRSGILTRKLSLTFFERLQTLRIDQSPFDRRWGMATLSVDTAAAGPANHVIRVAYLDESFASEEFTLLQRAAATHRPKWQ